MSEPTLSQVDPDIAAQFIDEVLLERIAGSVRELCDKFPAPGIGPNPSK